MGHLSNETPEPSVLQSGLRGVCPRCGQGKLLKGLTVLPSCGHCGLDYSGHEKGDGPAFFAVMIVSIFVGMAATLTEVFFQPPLWLHILVWLPTIVVSCWYILRWSKGIIIALQYKHLGHTFDHD